MVRASQVQPQLPAAQPQAQPRMMVPNPSVPAGGGFQADGPLAGLGITPLDEST